MLFVLRGRLKGNRKKEVLFLLSRFSVRESDALSVRRIREQALALSPRLVSLRRTLHACPEVGLELPETVRVVSARLRRLSVPFRRTGYGIVAQIGREARGNVLLRADLDALPVREASNLSFRAQNGACHACGHDLHAAMLLGAATLLKRRERALPCGVRLLFQSGEEILSGARAAIADGICRDVFCAFSMHCVLSPSLPTGTVVLPPEGAVAPAARFFRIRISGTGGHGGRSYATPLRAAVGLAARIEARESVSLTGLDGGETYNVVSPSVILRGSIRAMEDARADRDAEELSRLVRTYCAETGVRATLLFPHSCPSLKNDPILHESACAPSSPLASLIVASEPSQAVGGSEDFAYISRCVPSLYFALGAGSGPHGLHHPAAVFDERCLPYGTAAYVLAALLGMRGK